MLSFLLLAVLVAQDHRLTPFPSRPVERAPLLDDTLPPPDLPEVPPIPDSIIFPPMPKEDPDHWLGVDKLYHFAGSFATVGASHYLVGSRLNSQFDVNLEEPVPTAIALGGTFALGVTKELCDLGGPTKLFSWKDLTFDVLGIGAGYLVFIHDWKND